MFIYNSMKKLSFLFAMLCVQMSCLAGVSCNTIGDTVYCSGRDSDGNYVSTTTNKIGNTTYTTGRIGDDKIRTSLRNKSENMYSQIFVFYPKSPIRRTSSYSNFIQINGNFLLD